MTTTFDFRSDTVTRPSPAMYAAISTAALGDDVYRDDPTTALLERTLASGVGKEAGLFVPSATQANLIAVLCHCARGDGFITGDAYHVNRYEAGGAAVLGSAVATPLAVAADGTLPLGKIEAAVLDDDVHNARTTLLSLENTHNGLALPLTYSRDAQAVASRYGLRTHLDGARLFNAALALGVSPARVAQGFDSVSICLSKGLGAPLGAVLCASQEMIERGRRWRKMLGGGLRQSGIVAACGLVALEEGVERLAEDHAAARALAEGLSDIDALSVDYAANQTNMVFVTLAPQLAALLSVFLAERGIVISAQGGSLRLVMHKDLPAAAGDALVAACRDFFAAHQGDVR